MKRNRDAEQTRCDRRRLADGQAKQRIKGPYAFEPLNSYCPVSRNAAQTADSVFALSCILARIRWPAFCGRKSLQPLR